MGIQKNCGYQFNEFSKTQKWPLMYPNIHHQETATKRT